MARSFYVGLVPTYQRMRRGQLLVLDRQPCLAVSVTFEVSQADRAGDLLKIALAHADYGSALAACSDAGFRFRAVNHGESQIAGNVGPEDYWACVIYTRDRPVYVTGTKADIHLSMSKFAVVGRVCDPATDCPEVAFSQAVLDAFAGL